jgi:hypothetical protein
VHRATSPVVPNTSRSLRIMIVELKRLINYGFGMNCMPPSSSRAIFQKMSMFIWGNKTGSVKSISRSLTYSTFPLRSPMTSTRGLHGSSGTAYLDMVLRLLLAVNIVDSNLSKLMQ